MKVQYEEGATNNRPSRKLITCESGSARLTWWLVIDSAIYATARLNLTPGAGAGATTGANLFGRSTTGTGAGAGTNIFGQSTTAGGAPDLFGSMSTAPTQQSTMFGGLGAGNAAGPSMFGKPAQPALGISALGAPAQPQSTGAAAGAPSVRTTKYDDLLDNMKKIFEEIESHIQGRVQISKELKERKVGEETTKGQESVWGVHQDLLKASSTLRADVRLTADLRQKAEQAVQDTIVSTRVIDGFRNPQQGGQYWKTYAGCPLEFFTRVVEQLRECVRWQKSAVEQIERKISETAANEAQYSPQVVSAALQTPHATFIALATAPLRLTPSFRR